MTGRVSGKTRPPQTSCVVRYFTRVLQLVWSLRLKAPFVKRTQCLAFMCTTAGHVFVTRPCGVKPAVQITPNSDPCTQCSQFTEAGTFQRETACVKWPEVEVNAFKRFIQRDIFL